MMMTKISPVLFYFILLQVFKTGEAQTKPITLVCPATFTVGQVFDIVCTINTGDASIAKCAASPTVVSFKISRQGGVGQKALCTANYTDTTCSGGVPNQDCSCTKKVGAVRTYTLKYVGDNMDQDAQVECSLCAGGPPADVGNCAKLIFGKYDL